MIDQVTVAAVVITVAIPRCRNAAVVVGAPEAVAGARALRARSCVLVRVIPAVVVTVTQPKRLDADVG